jgi:hypothetical protein
MRCVFGYFLRFFLHPCFHCQSFSVSSTKGGHRANIDPRCIPKFLFDLQICQLKKKKKIPGVNLPTSQLLSYLISLFVGGVFHEFGHAIAAS